jgi:N-acetylneuraminate lyase
MHNDGSLNLNMVEKQAEHLLRNGISGAFICGTTGEGHSLTLGERRQLTQRWSEVVRGTSLKLIVHVGHNCLADAQSLAADAEKHGPHAISTLAPSYFKPGSVDALVGFCEAIAKAAPSTPFYFYDIPSLTRVELPMPGFLTQAAARIPTLTGIKFTNSNLAQLLACLRHSGGAFNILYGNDESLLAGLALGARGAVGSTYNFAAPIYLRIIRAFERGDLAMAREDQARSVEMVHIIATYGYSAAAKAVMGMIGVDCGPARAPQQPLSKEQLVELRTKLDAAGFFDWIRWPQVDPKPSATSPPSPTPVLA